MQACHRYVFQIYIDTGFHFSDKDFLVPPHYSVLLHIKHKHNVIIYSLRKNDNQRSVHNKYDLG